MHSWPEGHGAPSPRAAARAVGQTWSVVHGGGAEMLCRVTGMQGNRSMFAAVSASRGQGGEGDRNARIVFGVFLMKSTVHT